MDPVTALGAAAAGAQFVGLAVKSVLGSAKLIQGIRDEPKRAVELLTWVEDEVTSMQTLLHPESLVFSHLTTTQYVQIAPHAVKARKAMDKVNNVLSPLVRDIDSLKNRDDVGKRIMLVWKSILTVKSMKSIETELGTVRLLNATLLRELQVCGLETQSLLRNQSTQVLSIVNDLAKRDEELRRSMAQINVATTNLAQTVIRIGDTGDRQHQEVIRMHMMQIAYLQAIQDKLSTTEAHTRVSSEANSGSRTESEARAVDIVKFYAATAGKGARSLRCRCRSNMMSETRKFGPFAYKTGRQASQVCPLHGRIGQKSYSIEANLSPWANGFLQLSLGMLFQGGTWSILPPLNFQGTVKRSESPIFRLIDDFISSYSTMERWNYADTQRIGPLEGNAQDEYIRLSWDSRRTKDGLAGVLHGIEEAAATGIASYRDMDERGSTLLTELALLFAFLGDEILNVEAEMLQLFRIAFDAKLDPMVPLGEVHDIRDFKVQDWSEPQMTIGDVLIDYAMETGTISASLYTAFLDYEGLAESTRFYLYSHSSYREVPLLGKAIRYDPVLAEVAGYCDLSLAIISRSLEKLRKCLSTNSRDDSWRQTATLSPLELALGWPEGMQLLIDHNYGNVLRAFSHACGAHDTTSARLLLSAEAAIPFNPRITETGGAYYFDFTEALFLAEDNLGIFRLAAEEIWSRRDILTTTLLDYLKQERMPYLPQKRSLAIATNGVLEDFGMPSLHESKRTMADLLSSAVHMNANFGSRHHQILFDVGFTDIDTQCGSEAMTPLGFFCQKFPAHPSMDTWCSSVLWLLKAGADPRIDGSCSIVSHYRGGYVQYFLAVAQNLGAKLAEGFVHTLGRRDERYMCDDCSCKCSSEGCIPSTGLWRNRPWWYHILGNTTRQCLARSTYSTRKWLRYWGYSRREKDFIYQEASRHEIFSRLGMTHLCCTRTVGVDDIPHIRMEEEESALNLELLLRFYVLLKKFYSRIRVELFWAHWWHHMDAILPPTVDVQSHEEIRQPPRVDIHTYMEDLENARDDGWGAALEKSGYKDWDYQDVIRDHCTKMLLKARAYKEKEIAWKRHRLVTRPRFIRKRPSKSSNVQSSEEWSSSSEDTE